jgi:nitronate monooxygenase
MTRLSTTFTELLGIDLPVVQAPLGTASTPELVAAVSNAGGLGTLSITWRSIAETRDLIRQVKELTDKPFGVNLVVHWDPTERLEIALEEGVRLISFFWGTPAPWNETARARGALVAQTVGSAAEAKSAVDLGVDLIVAQGWEAGGKVWGHVATMPLVPAVVNAVTPVPVLAAGGIADGRGLAAALCLGAAGVWIGTRFLLAEEANVHEMYRERLINAGEHETVYTTLFRGGWPPNTPLRTLSNHTLQLWEEAGRPDHGRRPGECDVIGQTSRGTPIIRYDDDFPARGTTGDLESMVLYAGESVGLVRRVQPAAEIVGDIARQAAEVLDRLAEAARMS